MSENKKSITDFWRWLADAGLYQPFKFSPAQADLLANLIQANGILVDCYCPSCKEMSTFRHFPKEKLLPPPSIMSRVQNVHDPIDVFLRKVLGDVIFYCARNNAHTLRIILSLTKWKSEGGYQVSKIGQLPSKLDLVSANIRKYSKLAPEDGRELHSSAICASSGFHVAAFVYLRRVFERRLEVAHEAAKDDLDWDESAYDKKQMRMEDRISALRNHLPAFLVENRKIYSILSKGIHELTEDECLEVYATIEVGITLVLDEEIEKQRRVAKLATVSEDLQKLQQKYNSSTES